MYQRVLCEPRHDVREAPKLIRMSVGNRGAHCQPGCEALASCGEQGWRSRFGNQVAANAQCGLDRRCGDDADEGLLARAFVEEEQLVAANALKLCASSSADAEVALREPAAQAACSHRRDYDFIAAARPLRNSSCAAVVIVQ